MKITNNQVFIAQRSLSDLNLGKFDKDVRLAIYKNVGELNTAVKNVQEKMEASKKELFKDLDEQAAKVGELRNEYNDEKTTKERKGEIVKELEAYKEYFEKEREFIEVTEKFGDDEVKINLEKIDFNKFVDGLVDSGKEFNALQLHALDFLFTKN